MPTWTSLEDNGRWLREDGSGLIVRTEPLETEPDAPSLGDDPAALRDVLMEAVAHDVSDDALGLLVKTILEEPMHRARLAGWRWTHRVRLPREHEPTPF